METSRQAPLFEAGAHGSGQARELPLHRQILTRLISRLSSGAWPPGSRVPGEKEIALEFGVSVGTARRALAHLEDNGVLIRRRGRGTHVYKCDRRGFADRFWNIKDRLGQPLDGRYELIRDWTGQGTNEQLARLCLNPGSKVWDVRRILLTRDVPVAIEHSVLDGDRFYNRPSQAHTYRLDALAEDNGAILACAVEEVRAKFAEQDEAILLEVDEGHPLLELERVTSDFFGNIVEHRIVRCRAEMVRYVKTTILLAQPSDE